MSGLAFTLGYSRSCLAQNRVSCCFFEPSLVSCPSFEKPRFHVAYRVPRSHIRESIRWAWPLLDQIRIRDPLNSAPPSYRPASHKTIVVQPSRCGFPSAAPSCALETSGSAQDRIGTRIRYGAQLPGCCGARNHVLPLWSAFVAISPTCNKASVRGCVPRLGVHMLRLSTENFRTGLFRVDSSLECPEKLVCFQSQPETGCLVGRILESC